MLIVQGRAATLQTFKETLKKLKRNEMTYYALRYTMLTDLTWDKTVNKYAPGRPPWTSSHSADTFSVGLVLSSILRRWEALVPFASSSFVAVFQQEALVTLADRYLLLVIRWLQLTTITIKATVHLTLLQPGMKRRGEEKSPLEETLRICAMARQWGTIAGKDYTRMGARAYNLGSLRSEDWEFRDSLDYSTSVSVCLSLYPLITHLAKW